MSPKKPNSLRQRIVDPKSQTSPIGERGPVSRVKPVTELGRLLVRRMHELGAVQSDLMQRVCKHAGMTYTRGQSAYVSMILAGRRPIPEGQVRHWIAALGWQPGSVEAQEFEAAAIAHRAFTSTGGAKSETGAAVLEVLEKTSEENRALRDRLAQLEAELLRKPPRQP
jgi:hypothetical protein